MIVYGIPNCNTVKKAVDWLKENQVDFEFHDFKKKGVTASKLKEWFDVFGWEKVINRNGLTFKKLSKDQQGLINSEENAIAYLIENTSAIKRPIVEVNGEPAALGFVPTDYEVAFKKG